MECKQTAYYALFLQEREPLIKKRVEYLASKRGVSFDECWKLAVTGKLEKITPDE
jgi:hypothetical protein